MTTITHNRMLKSLYFIGTLLVCTLLLQACSQKVLFQNSSVVPAAEGSIKLKKDKNNNYNIALSVMRLAEPSRLIPPQNVYIVWIETEKNGVKNAGQLKTSSGMFSKTLKSSLNTVTAFKPVRIFITAEDNPGITYPIGQTVLNTTNF